MEEGVQRVSVNVFVFLPVLPGPQYATRACLQDGGVAGLCLFLLRGGELVRAVGFNARPRERVVVKRTIGAVGDVNDCPLALFFVMVVVDLIDVPAFYVVR